MDPFPREDPRLEKGQTGCLSQLSSPAPFCDEQKHRVLLMLGNL